MLKGADADLSMTEKAIRSKKNQYLDKEIKKAMKITDAKQFYHSHIT